MVPPAWIRLKTRPTGIDATWSPRAFQMPLPVRTADDACSDHSGSEASEGNKGPEMEFADMGGGAGDDVVDDADGLDAVCVSSYPVADVEQAHAMCWQQADRTVLTSLPTCFVPSFSAFGSPLFIPWFLSFRSTVRPRLRSP